MLQNYLNKGVCSSIEKNAKHTKNIFPNKRGEIQSLPCPPPQIPKSSGEDEMDRNNLRWRKSTLRALVPQIRRLQRGGGGVRCRSNGGCRKLAAMESSDNEPGPVRGLILLLIPSLVLLVSTGRKQMALSQGFNWE